MSSIEEPRDLVAEASGASTKAKQVDGDEGAGAALPPASRPTVTFEVLEGAEDGPVRVRAEVDPDAWRSAADELPTSQAGAGCGRSCGTRWGSRPRSTWTRPTTSNVNGEDLGLLIGKHGATIDALSTSCTAPRSAVAREPESMTVDAAGCAAGCRGWMADRAAEGRAQQDRPVELDPMRAPERKIVHYLSEFGDSWGLPQARRPRRLAGRSTGRTRWRTWRHVTGCPPPPRGRAEALAPTPTRRPPSAPRRRLSAHVADGLSGLELTNCRQARRVAELGEPPAPRASPGLVLAAARQEMQVDLVESAARKCAVIDRLIRASGSRTPAPSGRGPRSGGRSPQAGGGAGGYDMVGAGVARPPPRSTRRRSCATAAYWSPGRASGTPPRRRRGRSRRGARDGPCSRWCRSRGRHHHLHVVRKVSPTPPGFPAARWPASGRSADRPRTSSRG